MVPITVLAFLLAFLVSSWTYEGALFSLQLTIYDVAALVVATIGVFLCNWSEEKPQKASIESL
jgi:hypothetical protein